MAAMNPLDAGFARDEESVVLLLVCQGLEDVCCAALQEADGSCRLKVLPAGGIDGEASCGKILLATCERDGVSRLLDLACQAPGVQSAFALLAAVEKLPPSLAGLVELAVALEASPRWPAAVGLWQSARARWLGCSVQAEEERREEYGTEFRLRRLLAAAAGSRKKKAPLRFRGSAVRDGQHEFDTSEVMGRLGGAAKRRMGWQVSLTKYDTELFAVVSHDVAVVGLPLFPEWRGKASGLSDRPERFFVLPREVRPYLRPDVHINCGRMRLRPSTCHLLLRLAGIKAGDKVLDPMGGVGTIAIEAAVHWPGVSARTSDISMDATKAAELNAAAARPCLASGSSLSVAQEDARCLQLEAGSMDAVVTDVPFGNRNRLVWVNGLLPAFTAELARVLRPGGRAVMLMTRAHARQILSLLTSDDAECAEEDPPEPLPGAGGNEEQELREGEGEGEAEVEDDFPGEATEAQLTALPVPAKGSLCEAFNQLACRKVVVGGWPAAVLVLERTTSRFCSDRGAKALAQGEASVVAQAPSQGRGSGGKGKGKGGQSPAAPLGSLVKGEPSDCLLFLSPPWPPRLRKGHLTDVLMQRWPAHFPTESVTRRVVRRGRVWVQEASDSVGLPAPLRQPWWSDTIPATQTVLFVPDYPRRSPHESPLEVLFETDQIAVVKKPSGLRLFGGVRTLANILAAQEKASLAPSTASDKLPAPAPVHFLEAELGGCVLVAKTASAALRLGFAHSPRRRLRAVVHGDAQASSLSLRTLPPSCSGLVVHRVAPSVRFGHISEVSCGVVGEVSAFRKGCANAGHTILGDTEFGGEDAPTVRRTQLFLVVETVLIPDLDKEGAEIAVSTPEGSIGRFQKLFAKEKEVWTWMQRDEAAGLTTGTGTNVIHTKTWAETAQRSASGVQKEERAEEVAVSREEKE
ncbi:unnamed protein product [Polarella glacialis]|uniref:Ribosomal RNA large subunit methyltransferase K/L-like methyltransferase domain-containing protein n=1 Tax=Polarella glacialis TaxID=89957 RepID=A0A813GQB1_POLGL|nr:unnamed protein product [Polarella glacialis]